MLQQTILKGRVEFFNQLEGRGFIRDYSNRRVFDHASAIESTDEFKTLSRDDEGKTLDQ